MSWAIKIEGLGKKYRRGEVRHLNNNFRDALTRLATGAFSKLNPFGKREGAVLDSRAAHDDLEFWALSDINLEIHEGETVGIIGPNGAGKSTLLKILSRITSPTCGTMRYRGRLASLLEVGTGFHRELTGRENIFLNGSILGMRRSEITRRLDEIVAFSGVEAFLDMPVKFYSSGMYVRLAFAVAAHLETDILLVDEVLAVGDAEFQKKCLARMDEVTRQGRTVIFVSHNMYAVESICGKAGLLVKGKMEAYGGVTEVVSEYQSRTAGGIHEERIHFTVAWPAAEISSLEFQTDGKKTWSVPMLGALTLRAEVQRRAPGAESNLEPFFLIRDIAGEVLISVFGRDCGVLATFVGGSPTAFTLSISEISLSPGLYQLEFGLFQGFGNIVMWGYQERSLEVLPVTSDGRGFDNRLGRLHLRVPIRCIPL